MKNNLRHKIKIFAKDQRGAFIVSTVLISFGLFSFMALAFQGTRLIVQKARLSDSMEQLTLALTTEENEVNSQRNKQLAKDYVLSYLPDSKGHKIHDIVVTYEDNKNTNLGYVQYKINQTSRHDTFLSSKLFPSFDKQVDIGGSAGARRYRSSIDVAFALDLSGSMGCEPDVELVEGGDEECLYPENAWRHPNSRINLVKKVFADLADELFTKKLSNSIAVVPFSIGSYNKETNICSFGLTAKDPRRIPQGNWYGSVDLNNDINFSATVASFPNLAKDLERSMEPALPNTGLYGYCHYSPQNYYPNNGIISLTSDAKEFNKVKDYLAFGGTLASPAMLLAGKELMKGKSAHKILILLSDGIDNWGGGLTNGLLRAGMCNKIRNTLSADGKTSSKIVFIGFGYDINNVNNPVDWINNCVGPGNYYSPNTIEELKRDINNALSEEVGHNINPNSKEA